MNAVTRDAILVELDRAEQRIELLRQAACDGRRRDLRAQVKGVRIDLGMVKLFEENGARKLTFSDGSVGYRVEQS